MESLSLQSYVLQLLFIYFVQVVVSRLSFLFRNHQKKDINFSFLCFVASLLKLYRQKACEASVSWVFDGDKYRFASYQGLTYFTVKELTSDHRPDRDDERIRVETAGGQVLNWGGVPRVNGQLAISRAIGDVYFERYVRCNILSISLVMTF